MKTAISFTIALLWACISLSGQTSPETKYQLLWEVKAPGNSPPSYLFGTMHVTDERAFQMPDSVLLAIQNTPGFALEIDFDSAGYRFFEYMYAKSGSEFLDEGYWKASEAKTKSWEGEERREFDPSDLFKLFQRDNDRPQEATFLDAFLYRLAQDQGKEISGLESVIYQVRILAGNEDAPDLRSTKSSKSTKATRLSTLIELYEKGDLEGINTLVNEGNSSDYFKEEVIVKRNYGMAERADSLMHVRPTFIGVGAAHLPGEEGLISLLRKRGYHLRPVQATYTGMALAARQRPSQPHWIDFERPSQGYRLQVPTPAFGVPIVDGQVKMYMGVDFPSGMAYGFYAINLPEAVSEERREEISSAMAESFAKGYGKIRQDTAIAYLGLPGREMMVEQGKEFIRVRVILDKDRVYLMLLGNNETVAKSAAAEHWFNSLEFFPPVPMLKQPRPRLVDAKRGFSMEMPANFDFEDHHGDGWDTGGEEALYAQYEIEDQTHAQVLRVVVEEFEDPYATGKLEDRVGDCINYMTGDYLDPLYAPKPFERDGVKGIASCYDGEYLHFRMHTYVRNNRLYMFATGMEIAKVDTAAMDSLLESVRMLPFTPLRLTKTHRTDSLFEALMPGPLTAFPSNLWPDSYTGRIDSVQTYFYHDQGNSLNASVDHAFVWEYFPGDNRELYQAIADGIDGEPKIEWDFPQNGLPATDVSGKCKITVDDTVKRVRTYVLCRPAGQNILVARLQLPIDGQTEALMKQFEDGFKVLASPAVETQRAHHFKSLVKDLMSEDSVVSDKASSVLSSYRLHPSEYDDAIAECIQHPSATPFEKEEKIFDALLSVEDSTILPKLEAYYGKMTDTSHQRMSLLHNLLKREWVGAHEWALNALKKDPTALDHSYEYFGWTSYLRPDSTGKRFKELMFLLEDPDRAARLAAGACAAATDDSLPYTEYHEKFLQILTQQVQQRNPKQVSNMVDYRIYQMLNYLAMEDVAGWRPLAHKVMAFQTGYLPGSAVVILGSNGEMPSGKEIKHALSLRRSREEALSWLLDNEMGSFIPGKYRKADYLAEVALDMGLDEYPYLWELVEKRKIYFEGRYQWLYVYRFAFEGDRDWTLGFAGPIPMDGLPESSYFPMSGSNFDSYSTATYKKLVKAWIKERVEMEEE